MVVAAAAVIGATAMIAATAAGLVRAHEARSALRRAAIPGHLEQVLESGRAGLHA